MIRYGWREILQKKQKKQHTLSTGQQCTIRRTLKRKTGMTGSLGRAGGPMTEGLAVQVLLPPSLCP